ncbi:MAG: hypothetical protein AB1531_04530 [Chloroflexota bacterium]
MMETGTPHPTRATAHRRAFLRFDLLLLLIATIMMLARNLQFYKNSLKFLGLFAGWLILLTIMNALAWSKKHMWLDQWLERFVRYCGKLSWLNLLIAGAIVIGTSIFFYTQGSYQLLVSGFETRVFLLAVAFSACTWFLYAFDKKSLWKSFSISALMTGVVWQLLNYFPFQPTYHFALAWSETSWYYYASFLFANKIYGISTLWPFLDIGKPFLLSAAYLIPNTPLWLMRVWQFALWVIPASLVAWLFYKRVGSKNVSAALMILFFFSWMMLGPVYFHLSLAVAMILGGFDRNKVWKSLFWLGLASLWAGLLRINWVPMPAILCLALYFLETPFDSTQGLLKYLRKPVIYAAFSLALSTTVFIGYALLSGRLDTRVVTKFTATFLWYRMWPNANLLYGIVPSALLVSAVLVVLIYLSWRALRYHAWRGGLLSAMLMILFAGGVYASMKIGGGTNLHNLDAYLVFLMVWVGYAVTNQIKPERAGVNFHPQESLLATLCFIPVAWSMLVLPNFQLRDIEQANLDLEQLSEVVQAAAVQGEPVLFIAQRHLLTFGLIPNVPLEKDYELLELMEMAMAGNTKYLERFQADLETHRYGLIVTYIENTELQDRSHGSAEENNAWVTYVLTPLHMYYQGILQFPDSRIEIYAPIP